jgi:hypothetical protein
MSPSRPRASTTRCGGRFAAMRSCRYCTVPLRPWTHCRPVTGRRICRQSQHHGTTNRSQSLSRQSIIRSMRLACDFSHYFARVADRILKKNINVTLLTTATTRWHLSLTTGIGPADRDRHAGRRQALQDLCARSRHLPVHQRRHHEHRAVGTRPDADAARQARPGLQRPRLYGYSCQMQAIIS